MRYNDRLKGDSLLLNDEIMISETKVMNGEFEALHFFPNIGEKFEENFPSEKKMQSK